MSPPSARANLRLMVRPRPVPLKWRWTPLSACTKGWKISAALSGAMLMPVSRTSKRSSAGSFGSVERKGHGHAAVLGELDRVADQGW